MSFLPGDGSGEGVGRDVAAALARASDDDLESSIVSLKAGIDAAQAELALRVAEFDRRGLADRRHVLSTRQWLKAACRMSGTAASSIVRFGRSLAAQTDLRDRSLAGQVPIESSRAIAALRDRHRPAFAVHGSVLVEAATHLDTRDLRRAIDHWRQHVAPEACAADVGERFERRRLSVNQTFDGMWAVDGDLDPESGHVVATAVRAVSDPANLDPDDVRSPAQRRADALTDVCRFWLDHNDGVVTSGGVKPHITVTVDYDRLRLAASRGHRAACDDHPIGDLRSCEPEIDGTRVGPEDLRRLACDADVVRMVLRGGSEVLDVGRATRTVPAGMRRALDHRDGGCTWAGCDAPVSWCDAHHIVHWADGGDTAVGNLRLLCRRHHRAVHDEETRRRRSEASPPDP